MWKTHNFILFLVYLVLVECSVSFFLKFETKLPSLVKNRKLKIVYFEFLERLKLPLSYLLQGRMQLFKEVTQQLKKVNSLMLTMKKNSIFKIIVYRQTDGLEIYRFHFLFAWVTVTWSKWVHNYFFTVKQYLVTVLSHYRGHKKTIFFRSFYSVIARYIRDQVLFIHFLLKRY